MSIIIRVKPGYINMFNSVYLFTKMRSVICDMQVVNKNGIINMRLKVN